MRKIKKFAKTVAKKDCSSPIEIIDNLKELLEGVPHNPEDEEAIAGILCVSLLKKLTGRDLSIVSSFESWKKQLNKKS